MDIRNGAIIAYNGISASLGSSGQFNVNRSTGSYFTIFNNGRAWFGNGNPVDGGFQMDVAGVLRGTNTATNADVMVFQGERSYLSFQSRASFTTTTSWIRLVVTNGISTIANIHIGGGNNTISSSTTNNNQRNVLIAPLFNNNMDTQGNTVVGYNAGVNLTAGSYNTLIGHIAGQELTTGGPNIIITTTGATYTRSNTFETIFIGNTANAGALDIDRVAVIGGTITDLYVGSYRTTANANGYPSIFTLNSAGAITGSTNTTATGLRIASGRATGNAIPPDIIFSTTVTGSSGAAYQTLTDRWYVKGNSGTLANRNISHTSSLAVDISGLVGITGSLIITGSIFMSPSSSFVLPLTASSAPQTGSAYWSGSLLFIWNGLRYMSASFA